MADGVHAPVDRVEAARREAVLDRTPPEPELRELPARDHAMLPCGEVGDRRIRAVR